MRVSQQSMEQSEVTFVDVLRGAKRGEATAIGELWRMFNPKLLRYLRAVVPSECEDVASETWIGLAKTLPSFVGDSRSFESLMFTVARRRVIDFVRKQSVRPELTTLNFENVEKGPGPEEIALSRDSLQSILEWVRLLPPSQAEVVVLRTVSGLDIAEIAEIVDKTPGAVRVLSHRGLSSLNQMMEGSAGRAIPRNLPSPVVGSAR